MKNRGTRGPVVYKPDYLEIQPGNTVRFIHKHKSHNTASIAELSPASYPEFMGKVDEKIGVTYGDARFYGVKCMPHYVQGMVILIKVGNAPLPESYRAFKTPGIADRRSQEIYVRIDKRQPAILGKIYEVVENKLPDGGTREQRRECLYESTKFASAAGTAATV